MTLQAIQQSQDWADLQSQLPNRQAWQLNGFFVYKLTISSKLNLHFLYLPGILIPPNELQWQKLQELAYSQNCSFIHVEPYYTEAHSHPGIKSPFNYIEPHTRYLDLTLSEAELLSQMKQKGRYNIRLATKKNLEIHEEDSIDNFYKLFTETTTRDEFSGHNQNYYEKFIQILNKKAKLFTAFYKNEPLASLIITYQDQTATYYYGASSNQHRNLMAPYLLQWHAILDAKKNGYKYYDFMGIAPINAKQHQLIGVSKFKEMFGGHLLKFQNAYDLPTNWKYWPYYIWKKLH